MARTNITVTEVSRSATEVPTQQAATTELQIANNDGRTILEIEASGGATEIEILVPGSLDGNAIVAKKYSIAESKKIVIGPFAPGVYNQPDGTVTINPTNTKGKIRAYHV